MLNVLGLLLPADVVAVVTDDGRVGQVQPQRGGGVRREGAELLTGVSVTGEGAADGGALSFTAHSEVTGVRSVGHRVDAQ